MSTQTAFVLSGGGAKGAWQLGVLKAVIEAGIKPDVIVGTSVGALNGAGLSLVGIEKLEKIWLGIGGPSDIQRFALWKLFWSRGVYHFGPLRKTLEGLLPDSVESGVPAYASALSCSDSRVKYISQYDAKSKAAYIDAIIGSSSLGLFHEPVNDDLIDGGHREAVPIKFAFDRLGSSDVWVIGTEPIREKLAPFKPGFPKITSFGMRTIEIMAEETYQNDLAPYINDRRAKLLLPRKALPIGGMEYKPELIKAMIKKGHEDGRRLCS